MGLEILVLVISHPGHFFSLTPARSSPPKAIRLLHFARVAQWVRRARMLVMQENGKLRSNGLTLRRHGLFEEMILDVLGQVAPYPNNSLTERAGELFFGD